MAYKISKSARYAVVGYGSWATAIVKILLERCSTVGWHIRNSEVADHIAEYNVNPKYLSSVHFDNDRLAISTDVNEVIEAADVIVLAVPSAFLKKTLEPLTVSLRDKFILSAIKGIIPEDYLTIAEYLNRDYGVPFEQIGIVTGPCHAEEVALERLSYLNVVTKDEDNGEAIAVNFRNKYIKANVLNDIYGTEYAAVLKNIYAVAVGICHGLGYGDNFLSVLIAGSAREMKLFMDKTYPFERDMDTSPYLGDLLVTSYSQFSRNRTFGLMIGKGYSVVSAQVEMNMIAEGYYAANCIHHIVGRCNVELPIVEAVYNILYKKANARTEMRKVSDLLK